HHLHLTSFPTRRSSDLVSNHTEIDLWVIVNRHVDLLLGLGGPAIVRRRVVVGDGLHGPLDELVALILETLAIAVFASVDTATVRSEEHTSELQSRGHLV